MNKSEEGNLKVMGEVWEVSTIQLYSLRATNRVFRKVASRSSENIIFIHYPHVLNLLN